MLSILLLFECAIIAQSILPNTRSLELSEIMNMKYQCTNAGCSPPIIIFVSNLRDCQFACLLNAQCRTASFYQSMNQCELFTDIPGQYGTLLVEVGAVTVTSIDDRQLSARPVFNWLVNGDGEQGPCQSSYSTAHPTSWNYNGSVEQMYYGASTGALMYTDPGPSDRGNCYFWGQQQSLSSLWQTVNMTRTIDPSLIDNQSVWFNISAWIGGYRNQDDNAVVSLTFMNQINQQVGTNTTLGPVLAVDRGNISSLLFRQAGGLVPVGARFLMVTVTMTRLAGLDNDGSTDNIAVVLYQ